MGFVDKYPSRHPVPLTQPGRTPSDIDVKNQLSMCRLEGASAREIAAGIFCSEKKALEVLLHLHQNGEVVVKSVTYLQGRSQFDENTKFCLPI